MRGRGGKEEEAFTYTPLGMIQVDSLNYGSYCMKSVLPEWITAEALAGDHFENHSSITVGIWHSSMECP